MGEKDLFCGQPKAPMLGEYFSRPLIHWSAVNVFF
jgi:hypothetical protein